MSNSISRRNFLRLSGAAVLAVSAAGVLAGCQSTRSVQVIYFDGTSVLAEEKIKVPAATEALTAEMLTIPEGYTLSANANLKIGADGNVGVRVDKLRKITIRFQTPATSSATFSKDVEMFVAPSATTVDVSTLTVPEGYTISSTGSAPIPTNGIVVVIVNPKSTT